MCNIADGTTPYACNIDLPTLLRNLEHDFLSAIIWFEANYMKLNQKKCHFMIAGNTHEFLWAKIGEVSIWESNNEKLLGLTVDKKLNFDKHLSIYAKKTGGKVSALARIAKIITFAKKWLLLKTFIESQFSYCPLIWMFCSRKMNQKMNHIHERALRMVYEGYITSFEDLLIKDESVSIHHRNIQNVATIMFKVKNNMCSEFVRNLFCQITPRSRSNAILHRPNVNTVCNGEQSLRWFAPIVWDTMVPNDLKTINDLADVKQKIKKWVPKNCMCRFCKNYISDLCFVTLYEIIFVLCFVCRYALVIDSPDFF